MCHYLLYCYLYDIKKINKKFQYICLLVINEISMRKSLGDYNIEKSSSTNVNNINWSQKKVNGDKKSKKKKSLKTTQIPSGTNIIYKNEDEKTVNSKKIIKINNEQNLQKSKENIVKRIESKDSSLGQVKERSYKRPGR